MPVGSKYQLFLDGTKLALGDDTLREELQDLLTPHHADCYVKLCLRLDLWTHPPCKPYELPALDITADDDEDITFDADGTVEDEDGDGDEGNDDQSLELPDPHTKAVQPKTYVSITSLPRIPLLITFISVVAGTLYHLRSM